MTILQHRLCHFGNWLLTRLRSRFRLGVRYDQRVRFKNGRLVTKTPCKIRLVRCS